MTKTNKARPRCGACKDTRHVLHGGKWVRCECVLAQLREIEFARAGIPESLWRSPLADLLAGSWFAGYGDHLFPSAVVPGTRTACPILIWLMAPARTSRRVWSWSWALRAAVEGGFSAARLKIRDGIDARFDREEAGPAWRAVVRGADVLVVDLDTTSHKFLPDVAGELYEERAHKNAVTLFVSAADVRKSTGLYGPDFCRAFAGRRMARYGEAR